LSKRTRSTRLPLMMVPSGPLLAGPHLDAVIADVLKIVAGNIEPK
jgi:hypothetical protein